MKYPKVHYQMQAMLLICRRAGAKVKDRDYLALLIAELESSCERIECMHLTDDFTGEMEDMADLELLGIDDELTAA